MTPKELRQKALSKIKSASILFEAGQYDDASYMVGYAAEYALKARYCTRKGWADFPDDRDEAERRGAGKIITHDLEKLLKLSDSVSIRSGGMNNIDWNRARDWSEQQRYRPDGSVKPEKVEAQIEETAKLCEELALYEIVEKLRNLEIEVSRSCGPFNFFGLADKATQEEGWEVLISAWWLLENGQAKVDDLTSRILSVLDDDLRASIQKVTSRNPMDRLIRSFYLFASCCGGFVEHHPGLLTMGNFVNDTVLPSSFIITIAAHPAPLPAP
jgi:HEPN domain-containing protein